MLDRWFSRRESLGILFRWSIKESDLLLPLFHPNFFAITCKALLSVTLQGQKTTLISKAGNHPCFELLKVPFLLGRFSRPRYRVTLSLAVNMQCYRRTVPAETKRKKKKPTKSLHIRSSLESLHLCLYLFSCYKKEKKERNRPKMGPITTNKD